MKKEQCTFNRCHPNFKISNTHVSVQDFCNCKNEHCVEFECNIGIADCISSQWIVPDGVDCIEVTLIGA